MVSNIKILSKIERRLSKPNVTYNLSITPEQAVMQWARDRLATAGIKNTAQMIIIRADAREIKLKLDESILGVFRNQPNPPDGLKTHSVFAVLIDYNQLP